MPNSNGTMLELKIWIGEQLKTTQTLDSGTYLVGADPGCHIELNPDVINEERLEISVSAESSTVKVLSPDGSLKESCVLRPSFIRNVQLGNALLEFSFPDAHTTVVDPSEDQPTSSITRSDISSDLRLARNYRFGKQLGRGGMGVVLEAEDLNLGRPMAVKVIQPASSGNSEIVSRFLQEAWILGQLEHPNIVPVHDLGVDNEGKFYYTMKCVRGHTLREILLKIQRNESQTIQQYPLAVLLSVFTKICDAIGFAHSKGIVHRDLKPANIMTGEHGEVLVLDWGLAKVTATVNRSGQPPIESCFEHRPGNSVDLTADGQLLGTPTYMAPEQAAGSGEGIDQRTDVFALGGILYSILSLHPPFAGKNFSEVLENARACKITPLALSSQMGQLPHLLGGRIPRQLAQIAIKALSQEKMERYQSVGDLKRDVDLYLNGSLTSFDQGKMLPTLQLTIKKRKDEFLLAAVAALLLAVTGVAFNIKSTRDHSKLTEAQAKLNEAQVLVGLSPTLSQPVSASPSRFPQSLRHVNAAIAVDPDQFEYLLLKGNVLEANLHIKQAGAAYRSALNQIEGFPFIEKPGFAQAGRNAELCDWLVAAAQEHNSFSARDLSVLLAVMSFEQRRSDSGLVLLHAAQLLGEDPIKWASKMFQKWEREAREFGYQPSGRPWVKVGVELAGEPISNAQRPEQLPANLHTRPLGSFQGIQPGTDLLPNMPIGHGTRLVPWITYELDLRKTEIRNLNSLRELPILRLNLAGTPVRDISALSQMFVIDLRLEHCNALDDLSVLAKSRQLETLTVPSTFPKSQLEFLKNLPNLRKLAYESDTNNTWQIATSPREFFSDPPAE